MSAFINAALPVILCFIIISVSAENFIEINSQNKSGISTKSLAFEKYHPDQDRDTRIIEHGIGSLVRPEFEKYPYLVEEDKHKGIFKYVQPESGIEVLIKITKLELQNELTIFALGEHGIGYPVSHAYVVLRKKQNSDEDEHKPVHFYINLAFIRNQGKLSTVEWSTIDPKLFKRNRLDQSLCRGDICNVPHFIFGTCEIASNKNCPQTSTQQSAILSKWSWKTNLDDFKTPDAQSLPTSVNNNLPTVDQSARTIVKDPPESKIPQEEKKEPPPPPIPAEIVRNKRGSVKNLDSSENLDIEDKVPNSLDLLLLKRSEKEAEIGDAHYPNSLLDVRQVKTSEVDSISESECKGCEKIGEFFDDFEEDPDYSIILGNAIRQLPPSNHGPETDLILDNNFDIPFVGYGGCNISLEKVKKLNSSKEIEDLIEFIQITLKLDCDEQWENRIRAMFTSRFKILDTMDGFSIDVSPISLFPKYKILTPKELETLTTALVLTQYTRLYREEVAQSVKEDSMDNKTVSRRTEFLTKILLRLIESFNKRFSTHLIKGLRLILRLLRDKFFNLLLEEKTRATNNQALGEILTDKYQVMALKEFILYGLGPSSKSKTGIEDSFYSFYTINNIRIRNLVHAYNLSQ